MQFEEKIKSCFILLPSKIIENFDLDVNTDKMSLIFSQDDIYRSVYKMP